MSPTSLRRAAEHTATVTILRLGCPKKVNTAGDKALDTPYALGGQARAKPTPTKVRPASFALPLTRGRSHNPPLGEPPAVGLRHHCR